MIGEGGGMIGEGGGRGYNGCTEGEGGLYAKVVKKTVV